MLQEYFDKIYLINFESRQDKYQNCLGLFKDLEIEDFKVIRPTNPSEIICSKKEENPSKISCTLSHMKCYLDALENSYNKILIFEDDICLDENSFNNYQEKISECIHFLKNNYWNLFYFENKKWISKNQGLKIHKQPTIEYTGENKFEKIEGKLLTHSYAIDKVGYIELLNKLLYNKFVKDEIDIIDIALRDIKNLHKFYYTPGLFKQKENTVSDIKFNWYYTNNKNTK